MHEKPAIGGPFLRQKRKFSESRTGWLGREDSNLRMGESKSRRLLNGFNAHSEKAAKNDP
jgi:hypothetical protein